MTSTFKMRNPIIKLLEKIRALPCSIFGKFPRSLFTRLPRYHYPHRRASRILNRAG